MSKLDELIADLCPDGVKYEKLSDVSNIERGVRVVKSNLSANEGYPVYQNSLIPLGFHNNKNRKANTPYIISAGAAGDIGYSYEEFWAADDCLTIVMDNDISSRFIYHVLLMNQVKIYSKVRKASIPRISRSVIENLQVPVPPLEVQREIVTLLDKFTEITAKFKKELKAELTARTKQYEFYENKILFQSNYEEKPLSELCTVNQGLQIPINERKTEAGNNRYFYITVQFLKNDGKKYYIENPPQNVICYEDDILVTRTGSTGIVVTGVKGCFHNNFFKVTANKQVDKKYLYRVLNSKTMYRKMIQAASGGMVLDLPHKKFYRLTIPVPSIIEQQRIVSILDRFDRLYNDISEGLPAEIEARQKQYEYYRDKLLTFKPLNA